jgi:pantothenate kinase-related protein Tda10
LFVNDLKVVLSPEDYAKAKQWRDDQTAKLIAEAEKKDRDMYEMLKKKFGGVE